MQIEVTFPKIIPRELIKQIIEGNIAENSKYICVVTFEETDAKEHTFTIESERAEAFYLIGITAGLILQRFGL